MKSHGFISLFLYWPLDIPVQTTIFLKIDSTMGIFYLYMEEIKKKQPSQSAHKCSYSELWEKIIENLLKCLVKFMSGSSGRGFYYFVPQFHYTFYLELFLQILFCTSMLQNHEIPFLPVSFSFWKWDNQTYIFHVYKSCLKLCKKFAKIPLTEAL